MNKLSLIAALLIGASSVSYAAQQYKIKPYETLNANIAFNELNRVAVKEGRIVDVYSNTDVNFSFDEEAGQVFVQPLKEGLITVSLKTESGLYQDILFNAQQIPSQTILLTGDTPIADESIVQFEKERSYVDMITKMLKAIVSGENEYGWDVSYDKAPVKAWRDMKMNRVEFYKGHRFDAEKLVLTNSSKAVKYLTEKNFLNSNDVVAIALSKHMLLPNESGVVYRVLRNDKF